MDNLDNQKLWREKRDPQNVRFINYKLLKNVSYKGEPVVPQILSEDSAGHINVEMLGGNDYEDILKTNDREISLKKKLQIGKAVIEQFKEIDKAGFVLFDRHDRNIRILSWKDNISVRQVDLEEMYDKHTESLYCVPGNREGYDLLIESYEAEGSNFWAHSIQTLAGPLSYAVERAKEKKAYEILVNFALPRIDVDLDKFMQAIDEAIKTL